MKREDIPIKTCDEIRDSIVGCPTPCNSNEQVVGNTIYETIYRWESCHPPIGKIERRIMKNGEGHEYIHSRYQPSRRPRNRLEVFLKELRNTGYAHKDIRDAWAEILIADMFIANAYIYDDRPVDVEALDDEKKFIDFIVYRLELLKEARNKAISRACRRAEEKRN